MKTKLLFTGFITALGIALFPAKDGGVKKALGRVFAKQKLLRITALGIALLCAGCELDPEEDEDWTPPAAEETGTEEETFTEEFTAEGYPVTLLGKTYIRYDGWGDRTVIFDNETTCTFIDDLTNYVDTGGGLDKDYLYHEYTDNWTYDNKKGKGNVKGGFSPGRFQLNKGGTKLTFLSFSVYGHTMEFSLVEKSGAAPPPEFTGLAGTKWLWGQSLLEFDETAAVFRRDVSAPYPWHLNTPLVDGAEAVVAVDTLGNFTLSAGRLTLEIINYRASGDAAYTPSPSYTAVFTRKNPEALVIPGDTLVGTEWNVGYDTAARNERFAECQYIIFFGEAVPSPGVHAEPKNSINRSGGGFFYDSYNYNHANARKGEIEFIGRFTINADGSELFIPSYKEYGHSMTCYRVR